MVKTIFSAVVVAAFSGCASLSSPRGQAAEAAPVNALWNDAGLKETLGFWLYAQPGGCPDLRQSAVLPLVFGTKVPQVDVGRMVNVADLAYCFFVPAADQFHKKATCSNGDVLLTYSASTKRYTGSYTFTMSDGTKKEGRFIAAYCPPSAPAQP